MAFLKKRNIIRIATAVLALSIITPLAVIMSVNDPLDVTQDGDGWLSFNARVAMSASSVATMSGDEVNFAPSDPIFNSGRLPIISVSYSDGITVLFNGAFPDLHFGAKQLEQWANRQTVAEAEEIISTNAQAYLEIAILLTDLIDPEDTPATNPLLLDPPVLEDNERIETVKGKDTLVITCGYFAIHFYNGVVSFGEGDFITRISNNPITGDWWE